MVFLLLRNRIALNNYFEEELRVKRQIYSVLTELGKVRVIVDVGCGIPPGIFC